MATVTQLFHWDMLTGPEMEYAAKAGGLSNPAGYKKAFKDLSDSQREKVENLYTDGDDEDGNLNVLARGSGILTITRVNTGAVDITVKASDETGRFLAKSVGTTFTVATPLMITGPTNVVANGVRTGG